jgi:UDP-N-acetylmuramoylalanine-D-glutamate ligase
MKSAQPRHPKKNAAEIHFPTCQTAARLLKTLSEAERNPFQGGVSLKSPACSSIDSFQVTPQAGEMLFGTI